MINKLKQIWKKAAESPQEIRQHNVSLAVTALMVEVMRMDDKLEDAEHSAIMLAIQQRFELGEDEIHALIEQARKEVDQALDMHQFTSTVVKGFPTEERVKILTELWTVALADGYVDPYEEQLIRRIADLLGIHHRQFIAAKIAASV
jgi:uncharacterized tellurite resistance protein B-like protein